MVKIGIVGSRRRNTRDDFKMVFDAFFDYIMENHIKDEDITIVSGGCRKGADQFAEEIAKDCNFNIGIHLPDKSKLRADAKWAYAEINYARNTLIAQDSDVLIACVAEDRKGGTEDTIKKYLVLGKKKLIIINSHTNKIWEIGEVYD